MKNETTLSPAAQAVLDAAADVYWDWTDMSPASSSTIAAAVLRAAADHLSYQLPFEDLRCIAVPDLLAIAAELEGFN